MGFISDTQNSSEKKEREGERKCGKMLTSGYQGERYTTVNPLRTASALFLSLQDWPGARQLYSIHGTDFHFLVCKMKELG